MNTTRSLLLATCVVALVVSACSQPNDITRAKLEPQFGTAANDYASGLAKYSSGVYMVGTTEGNLHATQKGQGDAYIRKYDTSGKLIWGKQFGTAANEYAVKVATDANNNAYVFGSTGGSLARPVRGASDLFVRKYTASGKVAWTQQKGLDGADYALDLVVSGNGVYVMGTNEDTSSAIYRFNFSGGTSWKKQLSGPSSGASDMTADGSGNLYLAGSIPAACDEPEYFYNCEKISLNKYTASGSLVWSKQLSLAQWNSVEDIMGYGSSLYLVEQTFDVPDDDSYTRLVKLNTSGVVQWDRYVGAAETYDGYIYDRRDHVSADSSGAYVASTAMTNFGDPRDPTGNRRAYEVTKYAANGSDVWKYGTLVSNHDGTDRRVSGFLNAVLARGSGDVYVAGAAGGAAGRGSEALLKRLNASTGRSVWQR